MYFGSNVWILIINHDAANAIHSINHLIWQWFLWVSYQTRNIAGCACAGNAGNVFPRRRLQRKPLLSDPGMHHGTCDTHVPWCMSGSLASGGGENVPGIPGACAPAIFRIWQEAHVSNTPEVVALQTIVNAVVFVWWWAYGGICARYEMAPSHREYGAVI